MAGWPRFVATLRKPAAIQRVLGYCIQRDTQAGWSSLLDAERWIFADYSGP
jgi:hypothetical protein